MRSFETKLSDHIRLLLLLIKIVCCRLLAGWLDGWPYWLVWLAALAGMVSWMETHIFCGLTMLVKIKKVFIVWLKQFHVDGGVCQMLHGIKGLKVGCGDLVIFLMLPNIDN